MGRLTGKTAVITGASGTIGAATAQVFADEGANVLLVARDEGKLASTVDNMNNSNVSYVAADIATATGNQLVVETALERYGAIDVFYALAGVPGPMKPLTQVTEEEWDEVHGINLRGMWLGLKAVIPVMGKGGSIILCSAGAGVIGVGECSPYVTSKHAIIGLGRTAAIECGPQGIRVNSIAVGGVESPMLENYSQHASDDAEEGAAIEVNPFLARIPAARFSKPEEMAKAALFLASDDSSYCTGSVLTVDGGLTAT
ncbi:MAG: NAD(P)-dependent dehydrogenase (short-subunit alcohol dehydrogenase family) [Halioglobus sp.]|jgi:NAD(P)-dependent dehydrogenase (short-subunit alcohol dehydrogenase family)